MSLTFADSAEEVLKRHSKGAPMHYREITDLAVANGLIKPGGQTAAASMNVAIRQDIKRQDLRAATRDSMHTVPGCTASRRQTTPLGGAIQTQE